MRISGRARRAALGLAATLMTTGTLAGIGSASARAADCQSWTTGQPPSPGSTDSRLRGVVVLSPCNAWAVGSQTGTGASQTLIEHWNGSSWAVVPSPSPGANLNVLDDVRAASPSSIWAVGRFRDSAGRDRTLIEHWNGVTWTVVPSPGPDGSELTAIRVVSARDAWAVGDYFNGTQSRTLILRWNGTVWKRVASPNPGAPTNSDVLAAVSGTSSANAWAVGQSTNGNTTRTLILHWNGKRWAPAPSPSPGSADELFAVAASSATNAWAAGSTARGTGGGSSATSTLILHWNGRSWTRSRSPSGAAGSNSFLLGLTATSSGNAVAVGGFFGSGNPGSTLVLRWDGTRWQRVPSPDLGPSGNVLYAVAASSPHSAWAVGTFRNGLTGMTLAIHCC
jgi:hypothetical protein